MFQNDDTNGDVANRFIRNIIGIRRNGFILPFYIERIGDQNRSPFELRGSFFSEGSWTPHTARSTDKDLTYFPVINGYLNMVVDEFFPVIHVYLGAPHRVSRGVTGENMIIHRAGHHNIDRMITSRKGVPRYSNGPLLQQLVSPVYFTYGEAIKQINKNGAVAINRNIAMRNINKKEKEVGVLVRERLIGKLEEERVVVAPSCNIFKQELIEAGVEVAK